MDALNEAILQCIQGRLEVRGVEISADEENKMVKEIYPKVAKLMHSLITEKLETK